jgi:1-acyl-sn-glycerol-3-phosphate acyltransferase
MPLMQLIIVLVVVGVVLWAINNYIPMQENIKKILNVVVVIVVLLFVLNAFGVLGSTTRFRIGRW